MHGFTELRNMKQFLLIKHVILLKIRLREIRWLCICLKSLNFANGIQVSSKSYISTIQNSIMNSVMAKKKLRNGTSIAQTKNILN